MKKPKVSAVRTDPLGYVEVNASKNRRDRQILERNKTAVFLGNG